jgi:hypothetical protein
MASAHVPTHCAQLRRLEDAYRWAASEYLRYETAQLVAILNGDAFTFQRELHEAEIRKEEAKYAVITHREEHGCDGP